MENENLQTMEEALAKSKKRLAYGSCETKFFRKKQGKL
jgi:hypothetical protein